MSTQPNVSAPIADALTRMDGVISVDHLINRAHLIQDAINRRMQEGKHYGVIPGTHRKALLKPGAEALADLFHLRSTIDTLTIDGLDDHREVRATCVLRFQDEVIVQRAGLCTTKETKYRWRTINTGALVPKEYFDKKHQRFHDKELLGGPDYFPRKVDNRWLIFHQMATPNLADVYNTVLKMAEKRAFVSAVIAALAASDALVSKDDPTYRAPSSPPPSTREAQPPAPPSPEPGYDPVAESNDRPRVLKALLEGKAEGGTHALMEAWQELSREDQNAVGGDFFRIKRLAEQHDIANGQDGFD